MSYCLRLAASAALISMATPAIAGPKSVVHPIQVGGETVRYYKGTATLDLELERGAVQISPAGFDHGSLVFSVAIYNDGNAPINFGIENIRVEASTNGVGVFTKDELVQKAENRATWSKIGIAVLGGLAAGAAASQRSSYRTTTYTPFGTYRSFTTFRDPYGRAEAAAISADTMAAIGSIQYQLDQTRAMLGDQIIQLTTVDPGDSYAGRIVLQKMKGGKLPQEFRIIVSMNGEDYPFTLQVAKIGTRAPAFTAITAAASRRARDVPPPARMASADTPRERAAAPAAIQRTAWSGDVSLVPAKTVSGFCIQAPPGYRGAGSKSRPAITSAMPRCE